MKKITVLALMAAMALNVTACGGSATQAPAPAPAAKEEAKAIEHEEAAEEEAAEEAPAGEAAETGVGVYHIFNSTGEDVTELYICLAGSEDKGENLAGAGMKDGEDKEIKFEAAADATLVLSFKTAGGYEAAFETLHIEEAPITLLAADAMTGATPITFAAPQ